MDLDSWYTAIAALNVLHAVMYTISLGEMSVNTGERRDVEQSSLGIMYFDSRPRETGVGLL